LSKAKTVAGVITAASAAVATKIALNRRVSIFFLPECAAG
jgi:hypothetical protein